MSNTEESMQVLQSQANNMREETHSNLAEVEDLASAKAAAKSAPSPQKKKKKQVHSELKDVPTQSLGETSIVSGKQTHSSKDVSKQSSGESKTVVAKQDGDEGPIHSAKLNLGYADEEWRSFPKSKRKRLFNQAKKRNSCQLPKTSNSNSEGLSKKSSSNSEDIGVGARKSKWG